MNLLLVEHAELAADGTCALADRRAEHLRRVLGVVPGQIVRAGVLGGGLGTAEILADDGHALTIRMAASGAAPPQLAVELVLAVPRPKVLTRVIETAAAFGIRRIDLTNSWRVDKSYLRSPRIEAGSLAHAARLGAEQGGTTHVPQIRVHERLMALLDQPFAPATKLVAHPGASPIEAVAATPLPCVLAIGPEGGWIERELATLVDRGFVACSLGTPILRVEAAVSAALGQLLLLARLR